MTPRTPAPILNTEVPLLVDIECEDDGRWLAEVTALPGVLAYGATRQEAVERAEALVLRVLADRLEHGEQVPDLAELFRLPAA